MGGASGLLFISVGLIVMWLTLTKGGTGMMQRFLNAWNELKK